MSCVLKFAAFPRSRTEEQIYLLDPHKPSEKGHVTPLDQAVADANEMVVAARAEAEGLRRQSIDLGYHEGLDVAAKQYCEAIDQLQNLMNAVREERETFFAGIESQVVKLSVEIAEKILRRELESDPEAVLEIVNLALLQLADRDSIALRVSPFDAELIKQHRDSIRESAGGIRQIEIIEDRRIDRGGCVAESSSGSLDARIGSQLSEVTRALMEATGDDRDAESGPK